MADAGAAKYRFSAVLLASRATPSVDKLISDWQANTYCAMHDARHAQRCVFWSSPHLLIHMIARREASAVWKEHRFYIKGGERGWIFV